MIHGSPLPPTSSPEDSPEDLATRVPHPRSGRHRSPGRARLGGPQPAERVCLVLALVGSVVAVVLSVQGLRVAAITVAALGLVLAVAGLVLGRRTANLRRGSGAPAR
ncbi:hypothetical protein ACFQ46_06630 [Kineococcus sp. GCM10028916]|uniref:hypothetical protein n=1 Tax=Kineococcus sp. GCM10028916 TaxID=3273394 RepID=UPI0036323787